MFFFTQDLRSIVTFVFFDWLYFCLLVIINAISIHNVYCFFLYPLKYLHHQFMRLSCDFEYLNQRCYYYLHFFFFWHHNSLNLINHLINLQIISFNFQTFLVTYWITQLLETIFVSLLILFPSLMENLDL